MPTPEEPKNVIFIMTTQKGPKHAKYTVLITKGLNIAFVWFILPNCKNIKYSIDAGLQKA